MGKPAGMAGSQDENLNPILRLVPAGLAQDGLVSVPPKNAVGKRAKISLKGIPLGTRGTSSDKDTSATHLHK